jgi:acyl-CoA hydrolase
MNWKDEYRSKLCSYEEAAKVVKSGDRYEAAFLRADTVVLAVGSKSENKLAEARWRNKIMETVDDGRLLEITWEISGNSTA